jgi:rhodanese-related sulfurtransferase
MKTIDGKEVKRMVESGNAVLVDLDKKEKFKGTHLKGSVNMPHDEKDVVQRIQKKFHDKNEKIIICSRSPLDTSARKVCTEIEKSGYKNLYNYSAAPSEWKSVGLAIG